MSTQAKLLKALLWVEWVWQENREEGSCRPTCPECDAAEAPDGVRAHDPLCILDEALKDAGYPDQAARDRMRDAFAQGAAPAQDDLARIIDASMPVSVRSGDISAAIHAVIGAEIAKAHGALIDRLIKIVREEMHLSPVSTPFDKIKLTTTIEEFFGYPKTTSPNEGGQKMPDLLPHASHCAYHDVKNREGRHAYTCTCFGVFSPATKHLREKWYSRRQTFKEATDACALLRRDGIKSDGVTYEARRMIDGVPARLDTEGAAKGKTVLTGPNQPGHPAVFYIDIETDKRTPLTSAKTETVYDKPTLDPLEKLQLELARKSIDLATTEHALATERNRVQELAVEIAKLRKAKEHLDYLKKIWASVRPRTSEDLSATFSALRNVIHHMTSHGPNISALVEASVDALRKMDDAMAAIRRAE